MEKIKNIQTEQIILYKHNTLLTQQRQHNIEIQEHKQKTTPLNKMYEELKAEMTQVKKTYAEITTNRENTNEQQTNNNDNPALKNMEKEVTELKTLIHLMHANNIENNKIITTLQIINNVMYFTVLNKYMESKES